MAKSLEADPNNPAIQLEKRLSALKERGILDADKQPQRLRLDIRLAAAEQLKRAGLSSEQISSCPLCTVAEPSLFYSWRRDHIKAVQWSGIVAQAEE